MESIIIKVWGDYACFTRPEMKVDRVTYDILTPSAAKGILDCIYWKPAMQWKIRKIHVINPIKYMNIRRNEVNDIITFDKKGNAKPIISTQIKKNDVIRNQRLAIILQDVQYVIEAEICIVEEEKGIDDNIIKHRECAIRRLSRGQYFQKPFLGTREFSCNFELIEDKKDIPECHNEWKGRKDLGYILHNQGYHLIPLKQKKVKIEYLKSLFDNCYLVDRNTGVIVDNIIFDDVCKNKTINQIVYNKIVNNIKFYDKETHTRIKNIKLGDLVSKNEFYIKETDLSVEPCFFKAVLNDGVMIVPDKAEVCR